MSADVIPFMSEAERLELFAAYLSYPRLHHRDFDYYLARPILLGCLRNLLHASKRAAADKAAAARRATFELVS